MQPAGDQVLSQGVGYGVVLGIGIFFALLMMMISTLQNRYTSYKIGTSEEFNTASRSVKPGLIASGIVSAWTWAATLLQSSTVTYEWGICGGYYYAAGATCQTFIMAVLAVRVKMIAPYCHTYLEVIHARYGNKAHFVFSFFALMTNLIVSTLLLLGGSAVVNAFTGMNTYAANFLIPVGVAAYVILGGLRATFLCDYTHTVILSILILYFWFYTYTKTDLIGGMDGMYRLLQQAAIDRPVAGNQGGSYLTLKSNFGLIFMIIQITSGFGTVVLDQGYWQRAIASKAETAVSAYIMGGIAWFAVPNVFSSCMGLATVALTANAKFPFFPHAMSPSQVAAGLTAPTGVVTLLGKSGAVAMLILLFMAVTSAASSEMIATSSILTFDIYQIHIHPDASSERLMRVSHIMVAVWAIVMSSIACLWNGIGLSLNWLFLFTGVCIAGAVIPVIFTVMWRKQSSVAAMSGAIGGAMIGIICWLVVTKQYIGPINISTTGQPYPMLAGNVGSFCSGGIIAAIVTFIKPDNDFDWSQTQKINPRGRALAQQSRTPELGTSTAASTSGEFDVEKKGEKDVKDTVNALPAEMDLVSAGHHGEEMASLERSFKLGLWASLTLTFITIFLIPIPMFLSHYIFSLRFFKTWLSLSCGWFFLSAFITSLLPVWESRHAIRDILSGAYKDVFGLGPKRTANV